jgi:putative colanic acid biosynthesis UDP-glucose lipid carrier transferase
MSAIGSAAKPALAFTSNERAEPDRAVRMPLLRWTYGLVNRLIMVGDATIITLSSLFLLTNHDDHSAGISLTQALLLAVLEAAVFLLVLNRLRRYRFENYEKPVSSIPALIPGLVAAWAVGSLYFMAFSPSEQHASALFLYWHLPQLAALVVARLGAWELARQVHRRGLVRRTVVLIGANPAGEAILSDLLSPSERSRYEVVRVFADTFDQHQSGTMLGVPIANDMNMLAAYAQTHVIDLVIVALPLERAIKSVELIEELHWIAADVVIPMDEIGIHPASARLATIAGISTLEVLHRPLKGSLALVKIAEDYIIASIALLFAAPFMLLVAIAIKLDSKGPVFFLQERTGFNTNSFWIYKFRTMTVDPTDDGSAGTMSRDNPRITRVGGILRRLSIDEIPQLINVLRGDMSIVGPRPYVPNMLIGSAQFRDAVRNCAYRYRLKPGITGLAQSSGLRSNALRSMSNAERSVEMDLKYIMNWSIWLDFQIMLRTVLVAMSGEEVF